MTHTDIRREWMRQIELNRRIVTLQEQANKEMAADYRGTKE